MKELKKIYYIKNKNTYLCIHLIICINKISLTIKALLIKYFTTKFIKI